MKSAGVKHDSEKPATHLLSAIAQLGTAAVLGYGARKYADHNWRKGLAWSRVLGALLRHTFAFLGGEDLDPESGLPHVDHMGCCVMFLQEYYRTHTKFDDRYKGEQK